DYPAGNHVRADQRVAYDQSPRFGGARHAVWATCTATAYSQPIRTENAVHTVEHGAVGPTYDPQRLTGEQVSGLINLVDGQPDTVLSLYPGLDTVVSVRSWGHQLKLDDPTDERLPRFITALRQNPNTYPEPGASCSALYFDTANPPAFDPCPPEPDAVPVTPATATRAQADRR
ncbi:DUF3105 domain-containing protein, partial [Mycobacteroides chelonae]